MSGHVTLWHASHTTLARAAGQGRAGQGTVRKGRTCNQTRQAAALSCFLQYTDTRISSRLSSQTAQPWRNRSQPVVLRSSGEDVSIMDLAGDRVAGCDSLAHLQLAR